MTMPKFEPVAWLRDTLDGGLSTMTDCCTNVVKEIWLKANPKNVERYTAPLYTADQLTEAYEAGKREAIEDLEQAAFEKWLYDKCPSGDVESVQRQWLESYEYAELAGKRDQAAELEAARAEIERLKTVPMKYRRMAFNAHLQDENAKLSKQLAAEQAKNAGLREVLRSAEDYMFGPTAWEPEDEALFLKALTEALSTPSDTSALEAIVKMASEVMRKKCADASIDLYSERSTFEAIHALPGVTLEDLK